MNYVKEALKIKSVKRTINIFAVMALLVVAAPLTVMNSSAAVPGDNGCFDKNSANAAIKISADGKTATAYFKVPQKCDNKKHVVSLVAYKIMDGNWENRIGNQYIYDSSTMMAGPGRHTLTVHLPNCAYQLDLIRSKPVDISTGGKQGYHLAAKVGGNSVPCRSTPKPPVPPTPTPNVPATTEVVNEQSTETPETLVNTGPGDVAAAAVGVSALGSLGYRFILRRRLSLDV